MVILFNLMELMLLTHLLLKPKITGQTGDSGTTEVEIVAPLKHLSNFSRTLELPLINCEVDLILTWSADRFAFKQKTIKQPAYFLKTDEFCSIFCHSNLHNFGYILGKVATQQFLEIPQKSKRAVKHAIFQFFPFPFFQISNGYCQKSYNGFQVFLGSSSTSQIFMIYTFLTKKRRLF